jgi:hypothetical protein
MGPGVRFVVVAGFGQKGRRGLWWAALLVILAHCITVKSDEYVPRAQALVRRTWCSRLVPPHSRNSNSPGTIVHRTRLHIRKSVCLRLRTVGLAVRFPRHRIVVALVACRRISYGNVWPRC